jgi:hypothetical protein
MIQSSGAPVYQTVEMLYVSKVMFIVRWNAHVDASFVLVVPYKRIHHVPA